MRLFARLRAALFATFKSKTAKPPKFPAGHCLAKYRPDQLEKLAGMWVPKENTERYRLPKVYKDRVVKAFEAYSVKMSKTASGRAEIHALLNKDQIRINGVYVPRDVILQKLPRYQRAIAVAGYYDDQKTHEAIEQHRKRLGLPLQTAKIGPRVRFGD